MNRSLASFITALTLIASFAGRANASDGDVTHVVKPGETLTAIATSSGTTVEALRAANPSIDDRTLQPGTVLRLPVSERWIRHTVLRGDTLFGLARRYGASVEEIQAANGLSAAQLEVGEVICIPRVAEPAQAAPSSAPPRAATPLGRWVAVRLPDGRRAWAPTQQMIVASVSPAPPEQVIEIARQFTGTPYRWGGESPNGADCSGFVEEVFRLSGYDMPRTADVQYQATRAVPESAMLAGDLVFFSTYEPGPSHVGIYVGDRRFIHASSSRGVTESRLDEPYYAKRYLGARRIVGWPMPMPVAPATDAATVDAPAPVAPATDAPAASPSP